VAPPGKNHVTISLIGYAPHTWSIGPWYWGVWELQAFEMRKNWCWQETSFEQQNPYSMY